MSHKLLIGVATLAALIGVPATSALAQSDSAIVVQVPKGSGAEQPRNSVHQPRQYIAKVSVNTDDLDLRTAYGRYALDQRMRAAADDVCSRLDELDRSVSLSGGPSSESLNCRQDALRTAQAQMRSKYWGAG